MTIRGTPTTHATDNEWRAYVREAEVNFDLAVIELRALGFTDEAIIRTIPAAKERVARARARYEERAAAYLAFRSAHERR